MDSEQIAQQAAELQKQANDLLDQTGEAPQPQVTPGPPVAGQPDYYQKIHAKLQEQLRQAVASLDADVANLDPLGPQDHPDLKAQLDPKARKEKEAELEKQAQQALKALADHKAQTEQLECLALLGQLDPKGLKEIKDRLARLVKNRSNKS